MVWTQFVQSFYPSSSPLILSFHRNSFALFALSIVQISSSYSLTLSLRAISSFSLPPSLSHSLAHAFLSFLSFSRSLPPVRSLIHAYTFINFFFRKFTKNRQLANERFEKSKNKFRYVNFDKLLIHEKKVGFPFLVRTLHICTCAVMCMCMWTVKTTVHRQEICFLWCSCLLFLFKRQVLNVIEQKCVYWKRATKERVWLKEWVDWKESRKIFHIKREKKKKQNVELPGKGLNFDDGTQSN